MLETIILMKTAYIAKKVNLRFFVILCFIIINLSVVSAQAPHGPLGAAPTVYCSSMCADYAIACYGPTNNQCYACDPNFFSLKTENGYCQSLEQNVVIYHELKSNSMSIDGYLTDKPAGTSCGSYQLPGQYVSGNYLAKTFDIPFKYGGHYQLAVKFGIGYIGNWDTTDKMFLTLDGNHFQWKYYCQEPTTFCSSSDCMKLVSNKIKHEGFSLSMNLTSSITTNDSSVKYWGVRELIIVLKTCYSSCTTCFGPLSGDCTSCASGFYLSGNACVTNCPFYKIEKTHFCVESCPQGYYNDDFSCESCHSDCLTCNSPDSCIIYADGRTNQSFMTRNLLAFIILIILGILLLAFVIWKLIIQRLLKKVSDEIDNSINDRIIDDQGGDKPDEKQEKSEKKKTKKSKKDDLSKIQEVNTFTTLKFTNKEYPQKLNEKSFEDIGMKWIEPPIETSEMHLDTEQVAPRKKRNTKKKRPQLSHPPLQIIQKEKDEISQYYHGNIQIDNKQL